MREHTPKTHASLILNAIEDDRLYQIRLAIVDDPVSPDPPVEILESTLRDEANKIERTLGYPTVVTVDENPSETFERSVELGLYLIVPRHADREVVESVMNRSQTRVLRESHDIASDRQ